MPAKFQYVQIGKRSVKLSNLTKILYPDCEVVKAEVVQYYLQIAPTILRHIKRRPLSLIRFPDGIDGTTFFQKNTPNWAPDWIERIKLGSDEKKDYALATEEATLVWLANLACLELHQMQMKAASIDKADYMVFDLDPPEKAPFDLVVEVAFGLKELLESMGYHCFVKTTGGKGVHIFIPLVPNHTVVDAFEAAKAIAETYIKQNPSQGTLKINKEARKGKLLIDVFRNRKSQTVVCPYSLRGKPGAPVSYPLPWDELYDLKDPKIYNIRNVPALVEESGDYWEGMNSFAVELHTMRSTSVAVELPKSTKHKTPEQLKSYEKKRDFDKTSEPLPASTGLGGNDFVVHRHHASRLHYDLRLEKDGVLLSWAVPKGLPQRPGVKHLAIETEPHPVEYLDFEGEIPKKEYGGGKMWLFARGKFQITKEKKNGFYFQLSSTQIDGEFRIHNTKEKQWLFERVDRPQIDYLNQLIKPTLASASRTLPKGHDWVFEVKWDGIRAFIYVDEGQVVIRSKSHRDISKQFPELLIPKEAFRVSSAVFDVEIVCLDKNGRPDFKKIISRLHQSSETKIQQSIKSNPAYAYVFDCVYLDGRYIGSEPLYKRQEWSLDALRSGSNYRFSEAISDGKALFAAAREMGLEGVMAKRRNSKYDIGKRTPDWLKIKFRNTVDCRLIGYTEGKGERSVLFGALHIVELSEDGTEIYRGKVGTGFDNALMKEILAAMENCERIKKPLKEKTTDDAVSTWIAAGPIVEIEYASITGSETFREPVFVKLRTDL